MSPMLWYLVRPRTMLACPPSGPVMIIFHPALFPSLVFHEGEQAEEAPSSRGCLLQCTCLICECGFTWGSVALHWLLYGWSLLKAARTETLEMNKDWLVTVGKAPCEKRI